MKLLPLLRLPCLGVALILGQPLVASAQVRPVPETDSAIPARAQMSAHVASVVALPQRAVKTNRTMPRLGYGTATRGKSSMAPAVRVDLPTMRPLAPQIISGFAGTPSEAGLEPPDMGLAVGPNHVVQLTNDAFAIYSLKGTLLAHTAWPTFIPAGNPATDFYADPEVVYDNYHDRYIFSIAAANFSTSVGYVWVWRSDTNDPTGGWTGARFSMGAGLLVDFPRLGFNRDTILVSGALFSFPALTAAGSKFFVLDLLKAEAATPTFTGFLWGTYATDAMAPAKMTTNQTDPSFPTRSVCYIVQGVNAGGTSLIVRRKTCDWATPNTFTFDGWIWTVPAFTVPPPGAQPGGAPGIDSGDCRIANATFRNRHLETAHGAGFDPADGSGLHASFVSDHWDCTALRDGTGAAVAETLTRDSIVYAPGVDLFYPSCALNDDGDSLFVLGASTTALYPSLFSLGWRSTGLDGSFGTVKLGEAHYPYSRWGDYFAAALDPFDNKTVWVAGEYTSSSVPYATWISETNYKPDTTTTIDSLSAPVGGTVSLTAHLARSDSGDVSGKTIKFEVDGLEVGTDVTDGAGAASLSYTVDPGAALGAHSLRAEFDRTIEVNSSEGSGTLTVTKSDSTIVIPDKVGYPGGVVTLTGTLTRNSDGAPLSGMTVSFKVGATTIGSATTDGSGVASKNYTIPSATAIGTTLTSTASYAGDATTNAATDSGSILVKMKATLTITNTSGVYLTTINLKSTLKNSAGPIVGGTVHFFVDGVDVGSDTTDSLGVALLSHTLSESVGIHVLKSTFDGDATYAPAVSANGTLTVKAITTTLSVTGVTGTPGSSVNLKGTLKAGTTLLSGKTVEFFIDGSSVGTVTTDGSGIASLPHTVTESVGTHPITGKFLSDSIYAASSGSNTLTVKKATTKTTPTSLTGKPGQTVTIKATVKVGVAPVVGASVDFTVNGIFIGTSLTDATGLATTPYTVPETAGSVYPITATYAGDASYGGSTGSASLTIAKAATKTVGEVLTKPHGSSVNLGAKLTRTTDGAAPAGRTLNFFDGTGTTLVGTGTTDATGRGSITVTAPAVGVTVKYIVKFAGDSNYNASSGTASVKGS